MTSRLLDNYRPEHLLKRHVREEFALGGAMGAHAIMARLGLNPEFGHPLQAIGFRDPMDGRLRAISVHYPLVGQIVDLLINRHVSHCRIRRLGNGILIPRTVLPRLSWNARKFRGEGL